MPISAINNSSRNPNTSNDSSIIKNVKAVWAGTQYMILESSTDIAFGFISGIFNSVLPSANQIYPLSLMEFINDKLTEPILQWREVLTHWLPNLTVTFSHTAIDRLNNCVNYSEIVAVAISEEVVLHGMIQTLFLKKLPAIILKKTSPKNSQLVNHRIAQFTRIVLTSALFALAHGKRYGNCSSLFPQFSIGALYSYRRENGAGLAELIALHFIFDATLVTLIGGIPDKPFC